MALFDRQLVLYAVRKLKIRRRRRRRERASQPACRLRRPHQDRTWQRNLHVGLHALFSKAHWPLANLAHEVHTRGGRNGGGACMERTPLCVLVQSAVKLSTAL